MKKFIYTTVFTILLATKLHADVQLIGVSPDLFERLPKTWFSQERIHPAGNNQIEQKIESNLDVNRLFLAQPELQKMLGEIDFIYGIDSKAVDSLLARDGQDSSNSILSLVARRGSHLIIMGVFAEDSDGRDRIDLHYFVTKDRNFTELNAVALLTDRDLGLFEEIQKVETVKRAGLVRVEVDPYESGRGNESVAPGGFGGGYRLQPGEISETFNSKIKKRTSTLVFMGAQELQFFHYRRPNDEQDSYGLFEIMNRRKKGQVADLKQLFAVPSDLAIGLNQQSVPLCAFASCGTENLKYLGLLTPRFTVARLVVAKKQDGKTVSSVNWNVLVRDLYNLRIWTSHEWVMGFHGIQSRLLEDQVKSLKYNSIVSTALTAATPYASMMYWDYSANLKRGQCGGLF